MHRGMRHVTASTASLRCDGGLCRVPVIPSLGNRDLSRPELDVLLRCLVVLVLRVLRLLLLAVVVVVLLVVRRVVGRLGDLLLLLPYVATLVTGWAPLEVAAVSELLKENVQIRRDCLDFFFLFNEDFVSERTMEPTSR